MVVINKVALAITGFAAAVAAVPHLKPRLVYTINQVAQQAQPINMAGMYAYALAKHGSPVPPHVLAAAQSGQVVTNPTANDEEYVTKVTVGQTTLNLDFDTGSSDLWVFSNQLPAAQSKGHNIYKPSSNATLLSGESWSISYGDGSSAGGNVYRDLVAVGPVSTNKQAVEAAKTVSTQFVQDTSIDGLLGLAFSSINTVTPTKQTTFFDTVKSTLDQPLFAANLKHQAAGSYDFGFTDSTKYTGKITYTNVDSSQGFWGFTASGYKVGTGAAVTSSIAGIADTGTTLLLLPTAVVQAYYKGIKGATNSASAGGWVFDCSATLPDFTATISGYDAVVPGSFINFAPVSAGSTQCFGGIQDNASIGFSIFGDVFLKSQYVVFNSAGPKLGFAAQS